MALTGNKGEWSEIYTLFKLLADQTLYAGDGQINRIADLFYPIIKILRKEGDRDYEFTSGQGDIVVVFENGESQMCLPIMEFKRQALLLFERIKSQSGVFASPETESFMRSIYCTKIKASSADKTDIKIVIHDLRTGITPTLGFSIKSKMGNYSTLINSSRATNFTYVIRGVNLSIDQITEINSINTKRKIRDRIEKIKEYGGKVIFHDIDSSVFKNNLIMIDSSLPEIVSELLLLYYAGEGSKLSELIGILQQNNPLNYDICNDHRFYEYKLKRLLSDAALGLKPATVWTGVVDATGGYLVVKEDGDILCYHIYNKNEFEDYLINTSFVDTPSSGRHKFGIVEDVDGLQIFKLNFQIRFL